MARPRVFVSSTYYDLKHIRASLENFIEESLGYDAILSEKGSIAYTPDVPLDQSCYREVKSTDIFVLIIGGRYGSEKSSTKDSGIKRSFFDRYDSITKKEYDTAVENDIPIYILIERPVHAEYQTYLRNKDKKKINYAHVESVNVFGLIEEILSKPRNNPIQQFERYSEIESWLREQWAGLFRELLTRTSQQKQISTLAAQVNVLTEINTTLKAYLEKVVSKVAPDESKELIRSEAERLREAQVGEAIRNISLGRWLIDHGVKAEELGRILTKAHSFDEFERMVLKASEDGEFEARWKDLCDRFRGPMSRDVDRMRSGIGLAVLQSDVTTAGDETKKAGRSRKDA